MIPSMVPSLLQVSMSSRHASNDHAHGTHRVSLELLSQDSMMVPARLSLVWSSASCMFLAVHHVSWNGRSLRTFLPFPTQVSGQLRCWQSLRQWDPPIAPVPVFPWRKKYAYFAEEEVPSRYPPRLTNSWSHRNCRHGRECHTWLGMLWCRDSTRDENNRDMCHDYTNVVHSKQLLSCVYSV